MKLSRTNIEPGTRTLSVALPPQDPTDVNVRVVKLPTVIIAVGRSRFRCWWEPESGTLFWADDNPEPTPEQWVSVGIRIAGVEYT